VTPRKKTTTKRSNQGNPRFSEVVAAFATYRDVACESKKGFGTDSLKVNGKIFAMMASKGQFVVKLSAPRVTELVGDRFGEPFEPRPGRPMKEWLSITCAQVNWVELAREAYRFVKNLS
jgi:hypothetical protein